MELKPTSHNVASRNRRIDVWGKFERQVADAARMITSEASILPEQSETTRELRARYNAIMHELRGAAVDIDPQPLSTPDAVCHLAAKTDWCSFASGDYSEESLIPECRYVYRDVTVARNDNRMHRYTLRTRHESIEVRWKDDTREYVGEPELLALLHPEGLVIFDPDGDVNLLLDSQNLSEQSAIEDFLSTIAEPLAIKLRTQEPANATLPFDSPEATA